MVNGHQFGGQGGVSDAPDSLDYDRGWGSITKLTDIASQAVSTGLDIASTVMSGGTSALGKAAMGGKVGGLVSKAMGSGPAAPL